jgi:hypothetical protein
MLAGTSLLTPIFLLKKKARFGVPYSTCPCPRPAASLSTVLSALSQKLSLSSSSSAPSINKKALKSLGSIYTEANEMSHPSDHPAVLVDERRMEKKGKGKEKEDGKGVEHLPAFILDEHTASCAQLRSAFEASQAGANITGCAPLSPASLILLLLSLCTYPTAS